MSSTTGSEIFLDAAAHQSSRSFFHDCVDIEQRISGSICQFPLPQQVQAGEAGLPEAVHCEVLGGATTRPWRFIRSLLGSDCFFGIN